jgi:hypothetical protein
MDAIDRFGQELVLAAGRRHAWRRPLRALVGTRLAHISPRPRAFAHVRVALVVVALVLATAAITLAATGVILTGSPVGTARAPIATAGEGVPVPGGARLLAVGNADHPHHARAHLRADRPRLSRPARPARCRRRVSQ